MNKKANTYHLYKLDKKNKILTKLDSLEIKSERKDIQDIFENNLNQFFPKLEFLKTEHSFAVSRNRIDSIAYHDREGTFFIIEYKTLKGAKGGKVKNQALNYLNDLKTEPTEQFNLVNFWNREKGRQSKKWLEYHHIKWERAKVICISPFFHPHELSDKETILITIEKYENDILYLEGKTEQLELLGIKKTIKRKEQAEQENSNENGGGRKISLPTEEIDIKQFLLKREIKEPKIKQWVSKIDIFLKTEYSLKVKLFTGSQSKSSWCIKYSWNKNPILSLVLQQNYINVYLNKLTDNDLSLEIIKKYELKDYRNVGHSGELGNDWKYTVDGDNSFQQIFDLLDNYWQKLVNKSL